MTAWIHNIWTETDDVQSKNRMRADGNRRRGEVLALLDRTTCLFDEEAECACVVLRAGSCKEGSICKPTPRRSLPLKSHAWQQRGRRSLHSLLTTIRSRVSSIRAESTCCWWVTHSVRLCKV